MKYNLSVAWDLEPLFLSYLNVHWKLIWRGGLVNSIK